jgi:hypothetical protein
MDKSDDNDRIRPLSESELEWKHRINEKLLTVLDLSLLETIDESKARAEIREIALQLMIEESAPLSVKQRKLNRFPIFSSTAPSRCMSSAAVSSKEPT